jgi:hypothetical protein
VSGIFGRGRRQKAEGTDDGRLQMECLKAGVEIRRRMFEDIREVFEEFPEARGFVNCTGLGSYGLKGVEDKDLYPTLVCAGSRSSWENADGADTE